MISNFDFIKNKDTKLFKILNDAERLYRDGYFEQSTIQLRKFGEYVCKNTLGVRRTTEETFDDMLATLKDIMNKTPEEKEFIDDLYFIKKTGNLAAHGGAKDVDSMEALECLKRAFEICIWYALKNKLSNKRVLNLHFNLDVLMTGKKPKTAEKYQTVKDMADEALKEGVKEIADFAMMKTDTLDKSSVVIPFESKLKEKKVKREKKPAGKSAFKNQEDKPKKPSKNKIKSKSHQEKEEQDNKKENKTSKESNLLPIIVTGILLVLFISIILFILP